MALIVATCFLAVAAYYFLTPTNFLGKDGGMFGCGSPMSPNTSGLAKGQCGILEEVARNRSFLFLALALITALLGFLLFGVDSAHQTRATRSRLEDEDDDDELDDDEAAHERRPGLLAGRSERRARRADLDDDEMSEPRVSRRRARLGDEDGLDDDIRRD